MFSLASYARSLIAILIAILLSPIILTIAFLILIFMGRPVLFLQKRPGKDAKPFVIYKFRTMHTHNTLSSSSVKITRLGRVLRRLSLDELPQLWNVIKGEMAFVGPRPLLMDFLPLYTAEQFSRHKVLPGMTGWAQVNGRNNLSWEQRFEYDVWYVRHHNIWIDLKILFMTVIKVLGAKDIGIGIFPPKKTYTEKQETESF